MNPFYKNMAVWLVIAMVFILLFNLFNQQAVTRQQKIMFSDFKMAVEQGEVKQVTVSGDNIYGTFVNDTKFDTHSINDYDLVKELTVKGVSVDIKPDEQSSWWMQIFISWFPMLLLVGVWIFFMRQVGGGGGKAMSFGKSKAKLLSENQQKITFEDVAGIDEAKTELEEIIEFLKEPKKF